MAPRTGSSIAGAFGERTVCIIYRWAVVLSLPYRTWWWRRGELACYKSLITGKLLILRTAVNAKSAVFASPIHVEFTLLCKGVEAALGLLLCNVAGWPSR